MKKLKIAFFGLWPAFNHEHIGGTNSIIRRLSVCLKARGDDIAFVYYGCQTNKNEMGENGIKIIYCKNVSDSLKVLSNGFDHVLSIYLLPKDRLSYARCRKANAKQMRFHHLYLGWNESFIKRQLLFTEARLFPYNGCLFCVSPRIHRYVSTWAQKARLLLPPVPNTFFLTPSQKTKSDKIRVTYCGRVDAAKGALEVSELFKLLESKNNVSVRICGFPWRHKPETIALHDRLLTNSAVCYEPIEYEHWTTQVDEGLRNILQETDILLLPYRKLSSTVDTPLLLLEGMANLCAIISPNLGDIHHIYGASIFNLADKWRTDVVLKLIENAAIHLSAERKRVFLQSSSNSFDAQSVCSYFRESIARI